MKYLISITLILILESAHAQSHVQSTGLPAVFLIGEYEDRYLELSEQHPDMFMTVYKNNLDQAYKGWSEFLMDIEDYAADLKFDIKGAKLWMNIYFNPDGTISNLAFFPKPNSRNIPEENRADFAKAVEAKAEIEFAG